MGEMLVFEEIGTGFAQKIETYFQGLFKDQIYFSRTLPGMSCYLFNKINHCIPTKLAVSQCLKLLFQLVIQGLKFICLFFRSSPEGVGLCDKRYVSR